MSGAARAIIAIWLGTMLALIMVLVADPTPVWLRILAAIGFTGVSWLGWDLTIPQTMWHRRRDV